MVGGNIRPHETSWQNVGRPMRKIWYLCMTIGFLWLMAIQLYYTLGIDFRLVMKAQHRNPPREDRGCLKCESYEGALAAAGLAHDLAPNVIWPAVLLLAGGCGAARNSRRTTPTPPGDDSSAGPSSENAEQESGMRQP